MDDSATNNELQPTGFVFVICQQGTEAALKKELARSHPNLRFAFSRPGFVTFKVDPESPLPLRFTLKSTLARTYGWSAGKAIGEDAAALAKEVSSSPAWHACSNLHVWQRDPAIPGSRGFEPGVSPLAASIAESFANIERAKDAPPLAINRVASPDAIVLDVVLVEPNEWWYGFHIASSTPARWPGGVPLMDTSTEQISRAYYKIFEALLWAGVHLGADDTVAEIGSAPGGSCQRLLELGAKVIAIDPAEMEESVVAHENLTWVRRKGQEVRKRDFRGVEWLVTDISATPSYTLETVGEIVAHRDVDIKGLILTLKLTDLKMVEQIPEWIATVRKMGFSVVKARQLAFNRREFCLIAAKDRFLLRSRRRK